MGVDYSLFWQLTPNKLRPFIIACNEAEKRNAENVNFVSWLTGIYVSHAIAAVLGDHRYPQEPVSLFGDDIDESKRMANAAELFGAYATVFNKEYREK